MSLTFVMSFELSGPDLFVPAAITRLNVASSVA
jgi:hypothetical protein